MSDNYKSIWRSKSSLHQQPWGQEIRWHALSAICGKVLYINEGHRTSFKYNTHKNEVLYLQAGKAEIIYADEPHLKDPVVAPLRTAIIGPGDLLNVQSGCPYRIKAIENCVIVEIGDSASTAVIRLEDDYGRKTEDEALWREIPDS